jgi:hypothetical protein
MKEKTILFRLFCNYRNSDTNLSFKNYIKKEIGDEWVYTLAKHYDIGHTEMGKKVHELSVLNTFLNHENTNWIINDYFKSNGK